MSDKTAIILFFMLFRLVLPFFVQDVLDIVGSKQIPIVDYIKNHGYPVETHEITTEDGYILSYHRIPHGKSSDVGRRRKPVLLQHGLLCSSAVWVLQGDSLGYLLADKEFDVWLGNARGNTYSRRHTRYDPDKNKRAFWDFSWHEMGYYDLHGYPVEAHEITTDDGYVLTYHRIPYGKLSNSTSADGQPVLLQHGLLGSSSVWVLSSYALGYALADAGFDVWLGNARGNTFSRRHVDLDPVLNKRDFWDFSWHEMGYYDLPASIDYILNVTKSRQLFYIGHSMGTTMFFVLGATRPEYMAKIEAAVLMAPVAYPWNIKSPLTNFFSRLHSVITVLATTAGVHEVFPYSRSMLWVERNLCSFSMFRWMNVCEDIMKWIGGFNEQELKRIPLSTVLQYQPAGASFKTLKHFRQISQETDFRNMNYDSLSNLYTGNYRVYGQFDPPVYDLDLVTAPLYIYYANSDWLSVPEDVLYTVDLLPNVKQVTKVPDDNFNHLDFCWADDAKTLVYDDVIKRLKSLK